MVDINTIRQDLELFKKAVKEKKIDLDLDELIRVDNNRRKLIAEIEGLRQKRNEMALERNIEEGKRIKNSLQDLEDKLEAINLEFRSLMVKVPTPPSPDTPLGESDKDNVEIEHWGEKPKFSFTALDHVELGKKLDILDLEAGAKVSGYRGYFLKNEGVMLVMALMIYALNKAISRGFAPMIPPTLVKEFVLFGSGYFKGLKYDPEVDEVYKIATSDKEADGTSSSEQKFLVGTSEPSLLAYFANEVLNKTSLPKKICGFSQCYRSEIGSYGKDTKGIYRVHEFMKVELVGISISNVDQSNKLQEEMLNLSKEMHEELGIPYRVLQICTGDLSIGKYRQFDIEAWLPGLERFGETGSASNFLDWQSRRLGIRFEADGEKEFVYMGNSTALASPRMFIAILENYQQEDGSVLVPKVLQSFTGFAKISAK